MKKQIKINGVIYWCFTTVYILFAILLITFYLKEDEPIFLAFFIFYAIPIFNLLGRNFIYLKKYYTSSINIFTAKFRYEKTFDISKELMFEKIKEVIHESEFRLKVADDDQYEILATTKLSFLSWGENLYISFEDQGEETVMKFCSVTLFQMFSWGRNQKNYKDLLQKFDDSLTV